MIKKYAWVIWISYKCTLWSIFGPLLCLKFANTLFTRICREFENWCNLHIYPKSFCNKNLAIRKVFAFSDSAITTTLSQWKCQCQKNSRDFGNAFAGILLRAAFDWLLAILQYKYKETKKNKVEANNMSFVQYHSMQCITIWYNLILFGAMQSNIMQYQGFWQYQM